LNVSVLIPSRGRLPGLIEAIRSLKEKAASPDSVEILVRLDDDDPAFHIPIIPLPMVGTSLIMGPRLRGYADIYVFLNELAEKASGDWLMPFNDDAEMLTEGWDEIISKHADPAIPSVATLQQDPPHDYPCFPVVSRAFYRAVGSIARHVAYDTWILFVARDFCQTVELPVYVEHRMLEDLTHREAGAGPSGYGLNEAMRTMMAPDRERLSAAMRALADGG
jgi:hypothetical protein